VDSRTPAPSSGPGHSPPKRGGTGTGTAPATALPPTTNGSAAAAAGVAGGDDDGGIILVVAAVAAVALLCVAVGVVGVRMQQAHRGAATVSSAAGSAAPNKRRRLWAGFGVPVLGHSHHQPESALAMMDMVAMMPQGRAQAPGEGSDLDSDAELVQYRAAETPMTGGIYLLITAPMCPGIEPTSLPPFPLPLSGIFHLSSGPNGQNTAK